MGIVNKGSNCNKPHGTNQRSKLSFRHINSHHLPHQKILPPPITNLICCNASIYFLMLIFMVALPFLRCGWMLAPRSSSPMPSVWVL